MSTQTEKLLAVQEEDLRILKLQGELRSIPAMKAEIESRSSVCESELKAARELLVHKQSEAKQVDLDVEAEKQKVRKLREQQMQLKSNKEFRAMEDEIKAAERAINKHEERELAVMEESERITKRISDLNHELAGIKTQGGADIAAMEQRYRETEQEIARRTVERNAKSADVDPRWLRAYEKILMNRKEAALVPIEHAVCAGCHMTVAPHIVHDAKRADTMTPCPFCGKLLY